MYIPKMFLEEDISPSLYENPLSVPTWNYIAVHCFEIISLIQSEAEGFKHLEEMITLFEPEFLEKWKAMPSEYNTNMYKGIVPFVVNVADIQAKKKLSQNKSLDEQIRIANELRNHAESSSQEIANQMLREANRKISL
ncbi:MAG: FMN-binding negative transcriptional regulator [Chitinophagaceae bacterium]|nr:FMN-binding negative transcriptional regulator [Chitinophagaceae bacterium]